MRKATLLACLLCAVALINNYGASHHHVAVGMLENSFAAEPVTILTLFIEEPAWIKEPPSLLFIAASAAFGYCLAILWALNQGLWWQKAATISVVLGTTIVALRLGMPLINVVLQAVPWIVYLLTMVFEMWLACRSFAEPAVGENRG